MEQIAAFMLLISCSDNLSSCKEISAPTVSYQSMRDCNTEIPSLLAKHAAGHTILGTCVKTNVSALYHDETIVWDISNSGKLSAEPVLSNQELMAAATLPIRKSTLR
jgi:hypothetical protein